MLGWVGLSRGIRGERLGYCRPQRQRSGVASEMRIGLVEDLVAQRGQRADHAQRVGRLVDLDARLHAVHLTGCDRDLPDAGLGDVVAVDLEALVRTGAVGPRQHGTHLGFAEAGVQDLLADLQVELGAVEDELELGLLHIASSIGLGRVRDPTDPFCTFFGHA